MRMFLEDSATPIMPRAALSALIMIVAMPGGVHDRPGEEKTDMKVGCDH